MDNNSLFLAIFSSEFIIHFAKFRIIHYSFIISSIFIIPKGFNAIIHYSKSILDRYSLFVIHLQVPISEDCLTHVGYEVTDNQRGSLWVRYLGKFQWDVAGVAYVFLCVFAVGKSPP